MSGLWAPPPDAPTKLGRHRQLAPLAGVHVSPIQLGAMSIGDKWAELGMGAMDKESSFKLLDAFYEAGGNFIDTANGYQDESSEEFIGEWMEKRGLREQIVLATKYTTNYKRGVPHEELPQKTQYTGNNLKSMHNSVNASLKKLRTDYVDVLYVHWWDYTTGIEEVMNGLHNLVVQGKVLYLGVSDTPAWVVAKANTYARLTGKTPFVIYQGAWSIMQRDFERDILPMALSEGMALAPWNVLAGGKIRTDAEEQRRLESGEGGRALSGDWKRTEEQREVCLALEKVAAEIGAKNITSVAIAYLMQKAPYVFPIIGGRKVEHLHQNLEALDILLTPEQIKTLDNIVSFDKGFPFSAFGDGSDYNRLYKSAGHFDKWPPAQAIRPLK
ncbi:aldo/keto reductase [Phanerochaete sordida]|uniref:Aldo/keto reductase n=1 Tax=Phanerochaete sordida TaxID=48140 RepID=A0A9P3GGW5_9APHY|nr:aldo/keto reductase [Phanerochaete sordida]